MKKFFALVLALVMALSLTTIAWGAPGTVDAPLEVNDEASLIAAVAEGGYIKLMDSFSVTSAGGGDGLISITDGKIVNLDMNGKTITVTDPKSSGNYSLFYITKGAELTVTGNGTITLTATNDRDNLSAIFYNRGGTLTIKNGTFTHNGGTWMAYVVDNSANSYGDATTNINGGALSSTYTAIRNVMVKVKLVNGTNVNGTAYLNITDGTISGTTSAIWAQAASADDNAPATGEINISGGNVGLINTARSSGAVSMTTISGDAVVEAVKAEAGELKITGGAVTDSLTILDAAGNPVASDDIISGGTFGFDASAYVVDGKQLLANGSVVPETTAGTPVPTLYVWDNAATDWAAYYIATGKTLDKLAQDASDNCLPCYLVDGEYFVEVKEAAATFKLVYGAKTVYLTPVAEKLVKYEDTASVLKVVDKDDAECGDYYVTNLDEDDVYYVSYDKKGEVDGIWVAAKNGSEQILVNGKIVDAEVAPVAFMFHDFEGYDVVNYQYTTVKCSECGKVATLYANAVAAGKNAQTVPGVVGYITFADYMDFGAVSAPSTGKVESAETFDAGIAMYVGMSVMAAAGSAVVLKKKD